MMTARCQVTGCDWDSGPQVTHDIAGCLATWHVYEEHPEAWWLVAGDRPPRDPDPRIPEVREAMALRN